MPIPTPFSSGFPLKSAPFSSRIQRQLQDNKGYYFIGFKPGFPLQASELNELQETFYVQQTLTQELMKNWFVITRTSPGYPVTGVPWEGCTPVNDNLITTNDGNTVSISSGWYLLKQQDFNGGFGVWVYNSRTVSVLTNIQGTYGIIVKKSTINCTTSSGVASTDTSLQDGANINVVNGPCGAARIKLEVIGFGGPNTELQTDEILLPIFTKTTTTIAYQNGYLIYSE